MPIIYTYPTVTPTANDLILLTDTSDSQKATKTATIANVIGLGTDEVYDLQKTLDNGTISTGSVAVVASIAPAIDVTVTGATYLKLATTAETTTGTDTTRAVTPDGLKDGYQGSSNVVTTGALNSGSITSGFGNIDIGSSTFDTTGAVTTGILQPVAIKHVISGNSAGDYGSGAEILYNQGSNGGVSFTTGAIYVLRAGVWNAIDCSGPTTAQILCAVALGADTSSGMLIKGCVTLAETYEAGSDSGGAKVYGSATDSGRATLTAPTSSGHFVRILGYSLNVSSRKMFFNPDNTYVKIA